MSPATRAPIIMAGLRLAYRGAFDPSAVAHSLRLRAPRVATPTSWRWAGALDVGAPTASVASEPAPDSPRYVWMSISPMGLFLVFHFGGCSGERFFHPIFRRCLPILLPLLSVFPRLRLRMHGCGRGRWRGPRCGRGCWHRSNSSRGIGRHCHGRFESGVQFRQ